MKTWIIIGMGLLAGVVSACQLPALPFLSSGESIPPAHVNAPICAGVTFGESDNGKTLQVPAGGNLIFQAETNPSTGYDWFAKSFESDLLIHDIEKNEYLGFSEDRVGSIGEVRVCLTALSPGQTPLEMVYERPWEADSTEPIKRVRVVVDIQP